LNQTLARADAEIDWLVSTRSQELLQPAKGNAREFVQFITRRRQTDGSSSTPDQFHTENFLQLSQLSAELTLAIGVIVRGGRDSAGGGDFAKRAEAFEGQSGLREKAIMHD